MSCLGVCTGPAQMFRAPAEPSLSAERPRPPMPSGNMESGVFSAVSATPELEWASRVGLKVCVCFFSLLFQSSWVGNRCLHDTAEAVRTGCYPHSPLRTALCSDSVTQPRRASTGLHQRRQLLVSLRFHAVLPWCTADPPHAGSTSPGVESTYGLWFKNPNKATISLWIPTLSWDVLRVMRNKRLISSANCNVTTTKGATLRMLSVRIRSWKNPCRISFG